ncbi:ABC transporter permease [Perlabentimonas gracilis]|uniref:ABC transporter permease n=1 Tax=Perlabentimonas gracilis TaxID=2715279 RepID=UPI001409D5A3|nr:FtsX-like permease family protein [Perlabentimonas gracilis]NHB69177.1 ABC transporter permease [Perlabentimonas gracilis]
MIKFLIKGLLRDKSRSRVPVIIVSIGVMLTVLMNGYIRGFMGDTIEINAKFSNGHLKVMTHAYAENANQMPNDLALVDVSNLLEKMQAELPEITWAPRIQFGGLVDIPDEKGETRAQGPAMGMGIDIISEKSKEDERLNLSHSLVRGNLIKNRGETILSEDFAQKLGVEIGESVTLIGSTMHGSMSMDNFTLVGTVSFGTEAIDRGAIIIDIEDARVALDMYDAASEILGFFNQGFYDNDRALEIANSFNATHPHGHEFAPVMKALGQQGAMGQYVALTNVWTIYISMVFVLAMSLVLWNAGLLGGLRRYGEVGIRIAMGEEKGHVYRTMIYESIFIGITGSIVGTAFGLFFAWLIQTYGIDITGMMDGGSMMLPTHIRARIAPSDFYIGFIPGLFSTILGTMLSGIGIYKRQTAKLFKELEA